MGLGAQRGAFNGCEFYHNKFFGGSLKAVFYANGKEEIKQKLVA
jgi:hypothetical protein